MQCKSGAGWHSKHVSLAIWLGLVVLLLTILACEEGGTDPTNTMVSQPAATTVPTSTPTSALAFILEDAPLEDSGLLPRFGDAREVLSMIPGGFDTLVYLNLVEALEDPKIRETLAQESVLAALGPIAGAVMDQVDSIGVAGDEDGFVVVSQGLKDPQALFDLINPLGPNIDIETYKGLEVSTVEIKSPFLNISFAISAIDEFNSVFAIRFQAEGRDPELVKSTIDVTAEDAPGALDDPLLRDMANELPVGLAVMLSKDCTRLGVVKSCLGVAVSAMKQGEDGVIAGLFVFSTPEAAQLALPLVEANLADLGSEESPVKSVTAEVTEDTIRALVVVDIATALKIASKLSTE